MAPSERSGEVKRTTKETDVLVSLRLGVRDASIRTGIGFFDHMLAALSFHGELGLTVEATGDIHVDYHHLVEDVGLVLGRALRAAIGDEPSIVRFGSAAVPMDDALALVSLDVSGRGGAYCDPALSVGRVRDFDACLVREFLGAFARDAGITLHVRILCGEDTHHRLEAAFKGLGLSLRQALAPRAGDVPSTKGTLGGTL